MKRIYRFLLSGIILLLTAAAASAQTARLYDSGAGLPSTRVNDLFQDSTGLLWIATSNGLYRFDGVNFLEFHHEEGNEGSLSSDLVMKVFEDSRGVIWIGTSTGLQIFDHEFNTFSDFPLGTRRTGQYIYGLTEIPFDDDKSGILVSASQFGLYVIDADTHELDAERRSRFTSPERATNLNAVFVDSKSRIWAGSELGGLFVFNTLGEPVLEGIWNGIDDSVRQRVIPTSFVEDRATGDIVIGTSNYGILTYSDKDGRISVPADAAARECNAMSLLAVESFRLPDQRALLVGTENDGIKMYSPDTKALSPVNFSNVPYNTERWKVHKLLEDNQGNLWVAAFQKGLMIVPQSMFGFTNFSFKSGEGPGDEYSCLTSICRDAERLCTWVGSDGNGLFCVWDNGRTDNFNSTGSGLTNDSIMGVTVDNHGTLWIATYLDGIFSYSPSRGFRRFADNDGVGTEKVFCLAYDQEEDLLYAGTHGNGVVVIDPVREKVVRTLPDELNKWINTLYFDRSRTLWIGSYGGHWCYSPDDGQLFRADLKDRAVMRSRVYAFEECKDGTVWIGTGEGLVRYSPSDGETKVYTKAEGLSSNMISGILEADDGSLWVSTSYGLSCINPQTGDISRYYEYDGLQGNEFRTNAFYRSPRGRMFFGGTKGMTTFYPRVVRRRLHDIPPVIFTRLTVSNKEVGFNPDSDENIIDKEINEATRILLPYTSNSFSLEYSVPEFTNPDRIRYSCRLERFDGDWKTVSPLSRSATYTNLPHGRYTMSVKAWFDGEEDNYSIREIPVRVFPPWYLSFWAFLVYAALAAGIATLALTVRRKERLHRQERKESALKETKLQMFTDISHEIRTPLNLVMDPLRKLMEEEKDPEKLESYDLMYRNASNVLHLMNRIEESRRLEAEVVPAQKPEEASAPEEDPAQKSFKSRKNLVLVNNNAEMRRYLNMELRTQFNVDVCATADEAWKKIIVSIPDAVVTDFITEGGMDGADLCGKIKRNPSTNLVPVIILSSQWDEDALRKCTENGADRYLIKPVPVDLLRAAVQQAIATRETIRNKYATDVSYDFEEITIPSSEKQFLPKVIDTIKAHISDPDFGVEELSREIGMSRVHMNRKLKESINISPSSFIKSIRLKQAAYLLVNNKVNISEVAYRVGFSTHSYFSSSFKEYFGMSPKDFVAKYSDPSQAEALNKLLEI